MAGSGRKVFAAGEVLRAADVDNYLMDQSVMRFAGTAARGSAIGTAASEGMVSYLDDTNTVQVYDGSAWKQVYPQAAMPSMVNIVPTSTSVTAGSSSTDTNGLVTFTATPQVTLNGVFSSAYKNYRVLISVNAASAQNNLYLRLASGGTPVATSTYKNSVVHAEPGIFANYSGASGIHVYIGEFGTTGVGSFSVDVFNPALARSTNFTSIASSSNNTNLSTDIGANMHVTASAYDGLAIVAGASVLQTGTIQVYGLI